MHCVFDAHIFSSLDPDFWFRTLFNPPYIRLHLRASLHEPQCFIGHCFYQSQALLVGRVILVSSHVIYFFGNEAEQESNGSGIPVQMVGRAAVLFHWTFGERREELLRNPGVGTHDLAEAGMLHERGAQTTDDRWP